MNPDNPQATGQSTYHGIIKKESERVRFNLVSHSIPGQQGRRVPFTRRSMENFNVAPYNAQSEISSSKQNESYSHDSTPTPESQQKKHPQLDDDMEHVLRTSAVDVGAETDGLFNSTPPVPNQASHAGTLSFDKTIRQSAVDKGPTSYPSLGMAQSHPRSLPSQTNTNQLSNPDNFLQFRQAPHVPLSDSNSQFPPTPSNMSHVNNRETYSDFIQTPLSTEPSQSKNMPPDSMTFFQSGSQNVANQNTETAPVPASYISPAVPQNPPLHMQAQASVENAGAHAPPRTEELQARNTAIDPMAYFQRQPQQISNPNVPPTPSSSASQAHLHISPQLPIPIVPTSRHTAQAPPKIGESQSRNMPADHMEYFQREPQQTVNPSVPPSSASQLPPSFPQQTRELSLQAQLPSLVSQNTQDVQAPPVMPQPRDVSSDPMAYFQGQQQQAANPSVPPTPSNIVRQAPPPIPLQAQPPIPVAPPRLGDPQTQNLPTDPAAYFQTDPGQQANPGVQPAPNFTHPIPPPIPQSPLQTPPSLPTPPLQVPPNHPEPPRGFAAQTATVPAVEQPKVPVSRIDPSQVPNPNKDLEETGPFSFPPKDVLLKDYLPTEAEYMHFAQTPLAQPSLACVPEYSSFMEHSKVPWIVSLNMMSGTSDPSANRLSQSYIPAIVRTDNSITPPEKHDPSNTLHGKNIGPLRCDRCRSYFCAYSAIAENGYWKCNFCGMARNALPMHVQHDVRLLSQPQASLHEHSAFVRAYLTSPVVEYVVDGISCYSAQHESLTAATDAVASVDLSNKAAKPAEIALRPQHFLFCVELPSPADTATTMAFHRLLHALSETVAHMTRVHSGAYVSFVTYSSAVHFYDFYPLTSGRSSAELPRQISVGDVQHPFVPLPFTTRCWLSLREDLPVIQHFLKNLLEFARPAQVDAGGLPRAAMGAAVKCAQLILSHSGGHVVLLPTSGCTHGIGALKSRDENDLIKKVDEKGFQVEGANAAAWWKSTATESAKQGISFDILLITDNAHFLEAGVLAQLAHLTSGRMRSLGKIIPGQQVEPSQRTFGPLRQQLHALLCRPLGHAGVLRARVSKGTRIREYAGHFAAEKRQEVDIPLLSPLTSYTVELEHEGSSIPVARETAADIASFLTDSEKRPDRGYWYFQAALLFTTTSGSRRLRVVSLRLPVTNQYAVFFRGVRLDAAFTGFSQQALRDVAGFGVLRAKDALVDRLAQLLFCYRRQCSSSQHSGQLILPDSLKLLPLYIYALLKTRAFRSASAHIRMDDKALDHHALLALPPAERVAYVYPFMADVSAFAAQEHSPQSFEIPPPVQLCGVTLREDAVYVLHDPAGQAVYFSIPRGADGGRWGVTDGGAHGVALNRLPFEVQALLRAIRMQRPSFACVPVCVLRGSGDVHEALFEEKLMEDRTADTRESYIDFLCSLHATIRELLLLS